MSDENIEGRVAANDADLAQARQAGIAGGIPPATEPLKAAAVNSLGKALARAIPALSGGQVEAPQFAPVTGQVDTVPPDIGAAVIALSEFVMQMREAIPNLDAYAFDPVDAMSTNDGLDSVQQIADGIASDKDLQSAVMEPAPEEAAPDQGLPPPEGSDTMGPLEG